MFSRFAFAWEGPDEFEEPTGFQGPGHGHEHSREHGHGRRGFGGPPPMGGPGFGGPPPFVERFFRRHFGPGGPGGPRGPRMFGRGDLKYVLLELLQQRPMHGYEMIKALEEKAGGFYTPSAGAVYPTLQLLEDRGWVRSQTTDDKKVYTLTDEGRKALAERGAERPDEPPFWRGPHHHGRGGPFGQMPGDLAALRDESIEVVALMRTAVMRAGNDPARWARLRAIVQQARNALRAFNDESAQAPQGEGPVKEV